MARNDDDMTAAQRAEHDRRQETFKRRLDEYAVGDDDPRLVPFIDQTQDRNDADRRRGEDRDRDLETVRSRYDESEARVRAASEQLETAQRALAEVTASRDEAHQRLSALHQTSGLGEPSAAELLHPGEATQLMFFPRDVTINAGNGRATFPAGIHPVPESLTTHPYLWSSGVRLYKGSKASSGAPGRAANVGQGTQAELDAKRGNQPSQNFDAGGGGPDPRAGSDPRSSSKK